VKDTERLRRLALYRAYIQACPADGGPVPWSQARRIRDAWTVMPLGLRVELTRRCHWLDAVFEVNPWLGRPVAWLLAFVRRPGSCCELHQPGRCCDPIDRGSCCPACPDVTRDAS
jgi:hypothetical protein